MLGWNRAAWTRKVRDHLFSRTIKAFVEEWPGEQHEEVIRCVIRLLSQARLPPFTGAPSTIQKWMTLD